MANAIDLITQQEYYNYEERDNLTTSPQSFKASSIAQFITQASSYAEEYADRPFLDASSVPVPTRSDGTEISTYEALEADAADLPQDLKLAACLLVRYFRFQALLFGMGGQSDDNKTKNYNLVYHHNATEILDRYKYYEDLNSAAKRLYDEDTVES